MVVLYLLSRLRLGPELKVFIFEMALVVAILNLLMGRSLEGVLGVPALIILIATLPKEYPADVSQSAHRYPWRNSKTPSFTEQGDRL